MSDSKLTITLFGVGVWGARIARILISQGVVLDIIDTDPAKQSLAMKLGARTFNLRSDVARDSDGIIIATPSTTHFALIRQLADRGIPIFVEKPLTADLQEARKLMEFRDRPIFVMHTWLYHPGVGLLARIEQTGELGELFYLRTQRVNWTSPRKDTDSIWTLLPHDLTITQAILGYYPEPQFAIAEVHEGVPRGLVCILGVNPHVMIEISNRFWQKGRELRAHFSKGTVSLKDEKTQYLEIAHGDHCVESEQTQISRRPFSLDPDPLTSELVSFLRFLEGGPAPESSLPDGIEVIERIAEIRRLAGLQE